MQGAHFPLSALAYSRPCVCCKAGSRVFLPFTGYLHNTYKGVSMATAPIGGAKKLHMGISVFMWLMITTIINKAFPYQDWIMGFESE